MILPKLLHAGQDALRNVWRFKARHLASLAVIVLAFLTVGLFLSLANNLRLRGAESSKDAAVVFYLRPDLPSLERDRVLEQVRSASLIAEAKLVEADAAQARFLDQFPDLKAVVQSLGRNPFPAAVEAALRDPAAPADAVQSFIAEVRRNPGVDDAVFNREGADRIRALGRMAEAIGLGFGGLLVLASIIVVSGVVSLNVNARRDEIEIDRLVGATRGYIRSPFLGEGFLLGVLGGLIAVVLVAAAGIVFPAVAGNALGPIGELIGFRPLSVLQILGLVVAGGTAGLLGSAFSLARLLKI